MSVMTPDQRQGIVDFATQFVGTPYHYGGTTPKLGFDCSGFTSFVMSKFGLSLPRTSGGQSVLGRAITFDDAQPGDLLFFGRGKHIEHVALVVRSGRKSLQMVHSSTSSGVRVEDIHQSDYWKKRIMFAVDLASL
jgi:cell wall-associated NlpC family hydrolase